MDAEISYDLVPEPEMAFVEGSFRLPGGEWQVFIFFREDVPAPVIRHEVWRSGVRGFSVLYPRCKPLNYDLACEILAKATTVSQWHVVRGPDSMQLR